MIRLLGNVDISTSALKLTKAIALIAYLAIEGQSLRRHIAELLWPDSDEESAYRNLRWLLSKIKATHPELIKATNKSLAIGEGVAVDCHVLQGLIAQPISPAQHYANILQPGAFLEDFNTSISLEFDEWLESTKAQFARLKEEGFALWFASSLNEKDYKQALNASEAWLANDPYNEVAFRALLTVYQKTERSHQEITARLEHFTHSLQSDLGIALSQETQDFVASITYYSAPEPRALPNYVNSFIGREKELARLEQALQDNRLISIIGAGGEGKTRLALEFAHRQQANFANAVFFVQLEPLAANIEQKQFIMNIALQLGLQGSLDKIETIVQQSLAKIHALVILDNAEMHIAQLSFLKDLLQAAPKLHLLVTSRIRLNLAGEWLLSLEGLNFSPSLAPIELLNTKLTSLEQSPSLQPSSSSSSPSSNQQDGLTNTPNITVNSLDNDALHLFQARAKASSSLFELTDDNLESIIQICQHLRGHALAIELVAGWIDYYSLEEIRDILQLGLGQQDDILKSQKIDQLPRHNSIKDVFEYSWKLLSVEEQEAFAKLAIFVGGFHAQAAEVVCACTRHILANLVNKSCLSVDSGRFYWHPLLKSYALAKLQENPQAYATMSARHAQYFALWFSQPQNDARQSSNMQDIYAEKPNLIAMLRWQSLKGETAVFERVILAIFFLYDGIHRSGNSEEYFTALAYELKGQLDSHRHSCLVLAGIALRVLSGETLEVKDVITKHLALLNPDSSFREVALPYLSLADISMNMGNFNETANYIDIILKTPYDENTMFRRALRLVMYSRYLELLGRYQEAKEILNENLALCERYKLPIFISACIYRLALLALYEGDLAQAEVGLEKAHMLVIKFKNAHTSLDVYAALAELAIAKSLVLQAELKTVALQERQLQERQLQENTALALQRSTAFLNLALSMGSIRHEAYARILYAKASYLSSGNPDFLQLRQVFNLAQDYRYMPYMLKLMLELATLWQEQHDCSALFAEVALNPSAWAIDRQRAKKHLAQLGVSLAADASSQSQDIDIFIKQMQSALYLQKPLSWHNPLGLVSQTEARM